MENKQLSLEIKNILKAQGIIVERVVADSGGWGDKLILTCSGVLSFDEMFKISTIFNTRKINVGTETRTDGYCDTCSYTVTYHVLTIEEYKIDKEQLERLLLDNIVSSVEKEIEEMDRESFLLDENLSPEFIDKLRNLLPVCTIKREDFGTYKKNETWVVSWKELYEKKLKEQDEEWERQWSQAGRLSGLAAFSNTSPKDKLPEVLLKETHRDGGIAFELTVR